MMSLFNPKPRAAVPAPLPGATPGPGEPVTLTDPAAVVAMLRRLHGGVAPVVLTASDGSSLRTVLRAVDDEKGRLAFGAELLNPVVQQLLHADEVMAVAYLNDTKVLFDLDGLVLMRGERHGTLQSPLPSSLMYFDRRGMHRVPMPRHQQPKALLRHPAVPEMQLSLRILDMSAGGLALLLPPNVPPIEPGITLQGVTLQLDERQRITVAMQLRHVSTFDTSDQGLRLGFAFSRLTDESRAALRAYVSQAQHLSGAEHRTAVVPLPADAG